MEDNVLQIRRKEMGMSQSELAEASGVNFRTLQDYEQGRKSLRSARVDVVCRLSDALGCEIDDIIIESRPSVDVNRRFQKYFTSLVRRLDQGEQPMSSTLYDDAFRTLTVRCSELMIPLINEAFSENYAMSDIVLNRQNEHYSHSISRETKKHISDSNFVVVSRDGREVKYQVECQSKPDKSMSIRLFEYSSAIALEDADIYGDELKIDFPRSAVIYLRHNSSTPDNYLISLNTPGGEISWQVPIIKSQVYSIDEIFEKKLYMLIPFYLLVYERELRDIDQNEQRLEALKGQFAMIVGRLGQAVELESITEFQSDVIKEFCRDIINQLAYDCQNVRKVLGNIMGGNIVDKPIFRAFDAGKEAGRIDGIAQNKEQVNALVETLMAEGKIDKDVYEAFRKLD